MSATTAAFLRQISPPILWGNQDINLKNGQGVKPSNFSKISSLRFQLQRLAFSTIHFDQDDLQIELKLVISNTVKRDNHVKSTNFFNTFECDGQIDHGQEGIEIK